MSKPKWLTKDGSSFYVGTKPQAFTKLEPGLYKITTDMFGEIYFQTVEDKSDELLTIEASTINEAVIEIDNFWNKREFFEKHKFPFRRGLLFHGPAGTGKSSTLKQISQRVVDKGGIAILVSNFGLFSNAMKVLRSLQPTTPVVAIVEDIDYLLSYQEVEILNVLDGFGGFDGVVYLATTNYINNIPKRVRNRPSRFDRLFFVDYPSLEVRETYFDHLSKKDDIEIPVKEWALLTEGLSYAHLKELFVSHVCFGTPAEEIIERLKMMSVDDLEEDNEEEPCDPDNCVKAAPSDDDDYDD